MLRARDSKALPLWLYTRHLCPLVFYSIGEQAGTIKPSQGIYTTTDAGLPSMPMLACQDEKSKAGQIAAKQKSADERQNRPGYNAEGQQSSSACCASHIPSRNHPLPCGSVCNTLQNNPDTVSDAFGYTTCQQYVKKTKQRTEWSAMTKRQLHTCSPS